MLKSRWRVRRWEEKQAMNSWHSMWTNFDNVLSELWAFPYPGCQLQQHASWLNPTIKWMLRQR